MKSIITSVSPYLCGKIASGDCKILVKKSAPKEVPFKAYIYVTRPKKFYRCGAVSTSDELLWLANGKVEMGDSFKFWADGDEYQCLNGCIIGEFICDRIDRIQKRGIDNNFDYCYLSLNEWGNDDIATEITDIKKSCIPKADLNKYGANVQCLYAWYISDLKIYDKPKELSEFKTPPCEKPDCGGCKYRVVINTPETYEIDCFAVNGREITRPPQSYMFVEEVETR